MTRKKKTKPLKKLKTIEYNNAGIVSTSIEAKHIVATYALQN